MTGGGWRIRGERGTEGREGEGGEVGGRGAGGRGDEWGREGTGDGGEGGDWGRGGERGREERTGMGDWEEEGEGKLTIKAFIGRFTCPFFVKNLSCRGPSIIFLAFRCNLLISMIFKIHRARLCKIWCHDWT